MVCVPWFYEPIKIYACTPRKGVHDDSCMQGGMMLDYIFYVLCVN